MTQDVTLSFGKHRGKKLSEVPVDYLRWLAEQPTILGKRDVPQAAQAYLASLPTSVANVTRYSKPTTEEEASRRAWMASKGNKEAARTLLAARNAEGFIPVDFEDSDGGLGFFFVQENGHGGFFVGTQDDVDVMRREAEKEAREEAVREAHPDLAWMLRSGEEVRVWAEYYEGDELIVSVFFKGQKVDGRVGPIPTKQRAWAKANGIVAAVETRLGDIGLTAARKATLEAALQ